MVTDKPVFQGLFQLNTPFFCYFTYLSVITFYGIRGIYELTDSRSVLEVFGQLISVLLLGSDDDRILFAVVEIASLSFESEL